MIFITLSFYFLLSFLIINVHDSIGHFFALFFCFKGFLLCFIPAFSQCQNIIYVRYIIFTPSNNFIECFDCLRCANFSCCYDALLLINIFNFAIYIFSTNVLIPRMNLFPWKVYTIRSRLHLCPSLPKCHFFLIKLTPSASSSMYYITNTNDLKKLLCIRMHTLAYLGEEPIFNM